jgi:hypothetical protein
MSTETRALAAAGDSNDVCFCIFEEQLPSE